MCATEKPHTTCGHVFTRHAESDRSQRRAAKVRRQSSSDRVPAGAAQSNCAAGQPTRVQRAAQPEGARSSVHAATTNPKTHQLTTTNPSPTAAPPERLATSPSQPPFSRRRSAQHAAPSGVRSDDRRLRAHGVVGRVLVADADENGPIGGARRRVHQPRHDLVDLERGIHAVRQIACVHTAGDCAGERRAGAAHEALTARAGPCAMQCAARGLTVDLSARRRLLEREPRRDEEQGGGERRQASAPRRLRQLSAREEVDFEKLLRPAIVHGGVEVVLRRA